MKMRLVLAVLAVFGWMGAHAQTAETAPAAPVADAATTETAASDAPAGAETTTAEPTAAADAAATAEPTATAEPVAATEPAHGAEGVAVGDPKAGELKASACAACHSVDGNSTDPQYPKIAGQHAQYTARQLGLFKTAARENPVMLGFAAGLSDQDMLDVGAYFQQFKAKPDVVDPELAVVGAQLYRGGDAKRGIPACTACHGPAGHGIPGPAYPALAGQHSAYSELQLKRFRDGMVYGATDNINAAVMSGVAKSLTDQDIAALAAYIQGLYQE